MLTQCTDDFDCCTKCAETNKVRTEHVFWQMTIDCHFPHFYMEGNLFVDL